MGWYNDFNLCIGVSIWTIIQTIMHVWWILYGRKLFACDFKIERKVELYVYLTYLYNDDECKTQPVQDYMISQQINVTSRIFLQSLYSNRGGAAFLNVIQDTSVMRPFTNIEAPLTNTLMYIYLAIDALWVVASVSLLIGTLVKMKERSALYFFSPWIIMDIIGLLVDLFCSIYFGCQISSSQDYMTTEAENESIKLINTTIPYLAIMAIVSGRLGVIWLVNLCLLIFVVRATWRAFHKRYADERRPHNKQIHKNDDERIKKWQLFYGMIGEPDSPKIDLSCTEDTDNFVKEELSYTTFRDSKNNENACYAVSASNSELKGHLPWSYISNPDSLNVKINDHRKKVVIVGATLKGNEEEISRF